MTESSQNDHGNGPSEEPKVITIGVNDDKGHPDSQSFFRVPTLGRSDNTPGFGVMCGGKDQAPSTWQEKLQQKCREAHINPPTYETFSERRGGRTAWSSRVLVSGQYVVARFWYDGNYLHNAREDAAEMALKVLVFNCTQRAGMRFTL